MPHFRKSASAHKEFFNTRHRYEHWYRDNTIYFITARCREKYPAFSTEQAKRLFWERSEHYLNEFGFVPIISSLLDNHYHRLGYLKIGENLGPMMQKIHGSVAKLVNDLLPNRLTPFWRDSQHHDYFDGCIRDVLQMRRAYRYVLTQSERHGICADWRQYPHTRINVDLDRAVKRAVDLKAFMADVPYSRYEDQQRKKDTPTR